MIYLYYKKENNLFLYLPTLDKTKIIYRSKTNNVLKPKVNQFYTFLLIQNITPIQLFTNGPFYTKEKLNYD